MLNIFSHPLFLIVVGILIALLVFISEAKKKTEYSEAPEVSIPTETRDLIDYLLEMQKLEDRVAEKEVQISVRGVNRKLNELHLIVKETPEFKQPIEKFADKYLPTIIDSIERFARMPVSGSDTYTRTKNKLMKTLFMFSSAVSRIIEKYEEAQSQDIEVSVQALQQLLTINGDVNKEAKAYEHH